ncbi:MAG: DUF354 domain-containing protein [Deltaproteobacteria bacterium]|nr:DUF354 domain-containing protein [Deltaproteobacteria bacterium]
MNGKDSCEKNKKIWIDLDNSPHIVFFRPIIRELKNRGYEVVLTARECFQVLELADRYKMDYRKIGRHYGKNKGLKVMGLLMRSLRLLPFAMREKPALALSHGSRSQIICANALRIPSVLIFDYEYSKGLFITHPTWAMAPEVMPDRIFKENSKCTLKYPGIKEDVYVGEFSPESGLREELKIKGSELLATLRPPALEANYQSPESIKLFIAVVEYLSTSPDLKMVILPRNQNDREMIEKRWAGLIRSGRLIIPNFVLDGLNLIWHSDIVISGGGTMNREAAALGAPVYSVFRGKIGAVDKYLSETGRLTLLENLDDIKSKIKVVKWKRPPEPPINNSRALAALIDNLEMVMTNLV